MRATLTEARAAFSTVEVVSATEFRVHGIVDESALGRAADESASMYERTSAAGTHTFGLPPHIASTIRSQVVEQALRTIERRVNELGVAESEIARYTAADQILVQLPGVSDVDRAKQIIKSTAQLRLTLVDQGPSQAATRPSSPTAMRCLRPSRFCRDGRPESLATRLSTLSSARRCSQATIFEVRDSRSTSSTARRSASPSSEMRRSALARSPSATSIGCLRRCSTTASCQYHHSIPNRRPGKITGVSREEMIEQVINLNSGALPADLDYVEERMVGASLGAASIRAGVLASLGGLGLVLLFMLSYYRLAGVNALISVVLNLLILLAIMAYIPVTLTLPGIAGLILTIGMGVDSNVLIFERLKEELATAQGPRSAVNAAFTRVWLTIIDTHVTSLIAAAFLFPVRHHSDSRLCDHPGDRAPDQRLHRGVRVAHPVRGGPGSVSTSRSLGIGDFQLFANARMDFTRWRWHALALSLVLIAAGIATVVTKGLTLGIDFSGGMLAVVEFSQDGVTEERIEQRFRDCLAMGSCSATAAPPSGSSSFVCRSRHPAATAWRPRYANRSGATGFAAARVLL